MDKAVRGAAGLVGTCAFTPAQDVTLFSDSSRLWGSPVSTPPPSIHRSASIGCTVPSSPLLLPGTWGRVEEGRARPPCPARPSRPPGAHTPFVSRSSKPAGCDAFCPVPQVFLALCHS